MSDHVAGARVAVVPRIFVVLLPRDLVRIRGGVFFTRVLPESSVKRVTCAHAALLYGRTLWFSKSFLRYRSTTITITVGGGGRSGSRF